MTGKTIQPRGTIAADIRTAIVDACNDANCEAIEFFAVPDQNIELHVSNLGTGAGTYSKIITLFTIPAGQMGCGHDADGGRIERREHGCAGSWARVSLPGN